MTDPEILEAVGRYGLGLATRDGSLGLGWEATAKGARFFAGTPRHALELAIRHCRYEDDPLGRYGPTPEERMRALVAPAPSPEPACPDCQGQGVGFCKWGMYQCRTCKGGRDAPSPAPPSQDVDKPAWSDRLVFDFAVSETSPVIKGTWVTVDVIVSHVVDGDTWGDILRCHPELTEGDIHAALAYSLDQQENPSPAPEVAR